MKMKIHFNPVQFILSWLFIIPGLALIGVNTNWFVAIGVLLIATGSTIKVETRE